MNRRRISGRTAIADPDRCAIAQTGRPPRGRSTTDMRPFAGIAASAIVGLALMIFLLTEDLVESALPTDGATWFRAYLWVPIGIAAGVELRPNGGGHR